MTAILVVGVMCVAGAFGAVSFCMGVAEVTCAVMRWRSPRIVLRERIEGRGATPPGK